MSLFLNAEDLDTRIHSEIGYSETNLSLSIRFTFIRLKLTARHNTAFVHRGERKDCSSSLVFDPFCLFKSRVAAGTEI